MDSFSLADIEDWDDHSGGNEHGGEDVVPGEQEQDHHENPPDRRRTHPRIPAKVDVSMHNQQISYPALSENLSEGGMFIATFQLLPVNTSLDLDISFPDRKPIRAKGKVRWVRKFHEFNQELHPGVGVEFTLLKETDRSTIGHFIQGRVPSFHDSAEVPAVA